MRRFILHRGKRHPQEMGGLVSEAILTHLAVAGHVSASTQTQALCAILFLYKRVLRLDLPHPGSAIRPKDHGKNNFRICGAAVSAAMGPPRRAPQVVSPEVLRASSLTAVVASAWLTPVSSSYVKTASCIPLVRSSNRTMPRLTDGFDRKNRDSQLYY